MCCAGRRNADRAVPPRDLATTHEAEAERGEEERGGPAVRESQFSAVCTVCTRSQSVVPCAHDLSRLYHVHTISVGCTVCTRSQSVVPCAHDLSRLYRVHKIVGCTVCTRSQSVVPCAHDLSRLYRVHTISIGCTVCAPSRRAGWGGSGCPRVGWLRLPPGGVAPAAPGGVAPTAPGWGGSGCPGWGGSGCPQVRQVVVGGAALGIGRQLSATC